MRFIVLILMVLLGAGCSRGVRVRNPNAEIPGVVTTGIRVFKAKRGRYDAAFFVRNDAQDYLMIMSSDVSCWRGDDKGRIRSKPFSRRNVAFVFKPGQRRNFRIRCYGGGRGDLQIKLGSVYASDKRGRRGPLLASNVTYAVDERGEQARASSDPPSGAQVAKAGSADPASPSASASAPGAPAQPGAPTPPAAAPSPSSFKAQPVTTRPPRATNRVTAQPDWIIAIMEVDDVNAASRTMAIDPNLVRNIGDQLRIFVAERGVRTIDKSATERALKDIMQDMKQESYKNCYEDGCQIELGKALAASHILRTKITRFGSRCVLNAELIELRSEVAISAASARGGCGPEGFLSMSEQVAASITGR